ncbi:hypothetical protein A0128_00755 [Leptospira tipperaryensis]|uniref:Uncharacterized protein n=1 Tax=Leptospira tipperaryensis TaxID=2564040 RepID=A0A1D7USN3_9LEPT|nr:FecR domain-containing protein [Leptospira tipperaryensis]AOP32534.1 hypothetical protein A0128_00755 [Leptospira tipperaryensis]
MKLKVDNIEQFEDLLGKYLFGELNTEGKKELLDFVLKNGKARSMYQAATQTNAIVSYAFSDSKDESGSEAKKNQFGKLLEFKNSIFRSSWIVSSLAAAILLVSGISIWFGFQSDSETKLDQAFINSYGDCKIDGIASQPGANLLNRKLVSGNYSICEFQVEGAKSVAVRVLPDSEVSVTGNRKNSSVNVDRGSVLIDSINSKSVDSDGLLSILSPDVRALLVGTKVVYSRKIGESHSELDLNVLDGKVEIETGPSVAFEKTANILSEEERDFLKLNFPILFQSKKVEINRGQSLSWKGIPESGLKKIRSLEKSIEEAKAKGIKVESDFVFALSSDVQKLNGDHVFAIDQNLSKKIKNLLPSEEKDLTAKFNSMVRFPPTDLREVEKLKSLVAKLDNTPLIQILKDKNQPDIERVIYFKDGSKVKGFVYQHDSFYILLKTDGNLLFPIDAVDSIDFE